MRGVQDAAIGGTIVECKENYQGRETMACIDPVKSMLMSTFTASNLDEFIQWVTSDECQPTKCDR